MQCMMIASAPVPSISMNLALQYRTKCINLPTPTPTTPAMPEPPTPFLSSIAEVCIMTAGHKKTTDSLLQLGIGPFQVFDFTSSTVSERSFRGSPGEYELKVCFAKQGSLVFEIMQPVKGEGLMAEYLDQVNFCS
jgi:methylmalonyl-CoA/ethylmalonyl-CoA epimerase